MKKKTASKAFTLVELLIVIAIIGVLAGLIFPAVTRVMGMGSKMQSMNAASNIAKSWFSYCKADQRTRMVVGNDVYEWAAVLAQHADLNEASLWVLDFDPAVSERIATGSSAPRRVAFNVGQNWQIDPEFKSFPVSWAVANKTLANAPSATPLLWTRGLKATGEWDKDYSVFQGEGGHVAYIDAHVTWYSSLRDENNPNRGVLTIYNDSNPTANIAQAIRGGSANILQSNVE